MRDTFIQTLLHSSKVLIYYSLTNKGSKLVMSKKRFRRIIYKLLVTDNKSKDKQSVNPNNHAISTTFRELCKRAEICERKKKARTTVVVSNEAALDTGLKLHKLALSLVVNSQQSVLESLCASLNLALLSLFY